MEKTIQELTADLLAAPSACKEIKEAAQNYLDAVGKDTEAKAAKAYVAELEADIYNFLQIPTTPKAAANLAEDLSRIRYAHTIHGWYALHRLFLPSPR